MTEVRSLIDYRYFLYTLLCKKGSDSTTKHIGLCNSNRVPPLSDVKREITNDIGDFEEMVVLFFYEFKDKKEHDEFFGIV